MGRNKDYDVTWKDPSTGMVHTLSHRAGQPRRAPAVTGGDLWIEEGDVTLVLIFPLRQGLFH